MIPAPARVVMHQNRSSTRTTVPNLENVINTLKIVIESTGVPQLTVPQLAKYEVAFPRQLDEEEHIGAFFKQLDHLITLHQRM